MSDAALPPSSFFRLPRELRDQIYAHVFDIAPMNWLVPHIDEHFPARISFPDSWTKRHGHNSSVLFHAFPALCCTSRQIFLESTPHFLTRVEAFTFNAQSSKLFRDWFAQFPDNEGFKAIREYACYEWKAFELEETQVQVDLLTRLANVEDLHISFTCPTVINGVLESDHDWINEQYVYGDTGLPYEPRCYYTASPEIWDTQPPHPLKKYPPPQEYIAREKEVLQQKLQGFITAHQLELLFNLPKLKVLNLQFDVEGQGVFRHNLCHPLYRWFKEEWEKRGRDVMVLTGFSEDL